MSSSQHSGGKSKKMGSKKRFPHKKPYYTDAASNDFIRGQFNYRCLKALIIYVTWLLKNSFLRSYCFKFTSIWNWIGLHPTRESTLKRYILDKIVNFLFQKFATIKCQVGFKDKIELDLVPTSVNGNRWKYFRNKNLLHYFI